MNYKEFEKLSEVTEKKFPNGLSIPFGIYEQLVTNLKQIATDTTMDDLKKVIIYKDYEVKESESYVHIKPDSAEILHAVIGMYTEVQEIVQWALKPEPLDRVNILEEAIDGFWYLAILTRKFNLDLEAGMDANIAKLKKRYGDKFTNHAALNRDLKAERKTLETAFDEDESTYAIQEDLGKQRYYESKYEI